jgi:hypothetical protein
MKLKDPRDRRSAARTFALACPIVMLLLAVSALVLLPGFEAGEGDATSPGPDAIAGKEQIAETMLDLMSQKGFNCEQTVRLLLGFDEGATIDNEQIVRLLLGIDESDDIDREQIVRLLESLNEGEKAGGSIN